MNGNYVAINVETNALALLGIENLKYEPHISLMYSPGTTLNAEDIKTKVENYEVWNMLRDSTVKPLAVEIFESAEGGHSVVLRFFDPLINALHFLLQIEGLTHSYHPHYNAHMSISYGMTKEEAETLKEKAIENLNDIFVIPRTVVSEELEV